MLLIAAIVLVLTGCASVFTGHKKADQASQMVLERLDEATAQTASERYSKLTEYFQNFGVINSDIYRGAQPDLDQLWRLEEAGIVAVVDFRDQPNKVDAESAACADQGLRYFNLPWSGREEKVDLEVVGSFLEIVTNPDNLPVFVHCKRGAERTGTMLSVYRIEYDDWSTDAAYAEMNQYRFRSMWFGNLKRFVLAYKKGMASESLKLRY